MEAKSPLRSRVGPGIGPALLRVVVATSQVGSQNTSAAPVTSPSEYLSEALQPCFFPMTCALLPGVASHLSPLELPLLLPLVPSVSHFILYLYYHVIGVMSTERIPWVESFDGRQKASQWLCLEQPF